MCNVLLLTDCTWISWHLKLLLVEPLLRLGAMKISKLRITGPLWREVVGNDPVIRKAFPYHITNSSVMFLSSWADLKLVDIGNRKTTQKSKKWHNLKCLFSAPFVTSVTLISTQYNQRFLIYALISTHRVRVTHICVSRPRHYWFR